jgi:hypothetical protein
MCATDLDLELEFTVDETEDETEGEQAPGPYPIGGQAPGVAWGLAERHDDQDPIARVR